MKLSAKILSMLVVGILLTLPAFAQVGDGVVSGKVIGRDGMPAANVIIRVQRMNSLNAVQRVVAQTFETKTGKNGAYSVGALPQGTYQVVLIENGRVLLTKGDTPGDTITVNQGREGKADFDMTKAPALVAAAPTAADLAKDREEMTKAAANKANRDKAFKAGTDAYKAGAAAEPTARDEDAKAKVTAFYEEAVKQFQIVVEADPKQDVAFANMGNALNKLKKYDEAAAAYQKAIQLKPMESAYFNNLGLALGGAKKLDEAKAAFDTAASMEPAKAGDYLFNEGAMYNNNSEYPKAIEAFKRCVTADPNNKGCMLQEAISYFGSPETMPKAEPLLKKFLTLNPTPGDAETAKGLLEAINSTAPTEFKSDKAIADEKKAAEAKAAADAKAAAAAQKNKGGAAAAPKTR